MHVLLVCVCVCCARVWPHRFRLADNILIRYRAHTIIHVIVSIGPHRIHAVVCLFVCHRTHGCHCHCIYERMLRHNSHSLVAVHVYTLSSWLVGLWHTVLHAARRILSFSRYKCGHHLVRHHSSAHLFNIMEDSLINMFRVVSFRSLQSMHLNRSKLKCRMEKYFRVWWGFFLIGHRVDLVEFCLGSILYEADEFLRPSRKVPWIKYSWNIFHM